ncbi:MAG: hypothetical protein QXS27_07700 [Candidatus Jordarchaeaceae archaeon]
MDDFVLALVIALACGLALCLAYYIASKWWWIRLWKSIRAYLEIEGVFRK